VDPTALEGDVVARGGDKGAVRGLARGTAAWHVARVARSLHALPLCARLCGDGGDTVAQNVQYLQLADVLVARMMGWRGGRGRCFHSRLATGIDDRARFIRRDSRCESAWGHA
jgi:hypothetical protein